jgi:Na+/melibiose symporter-like transporter
VFVVLGILATDNSLWLALGLVVLGALVLTWFVFATRAKERAGREPLVSLSLLRTRTRTSNLGMVTQNAQWLLLSGVSFVVSAYLQVVRGFDAIQTGVIFSATTLGLIVSSLAAARLARRTSQRNLILVGFVLTIVGVALLLVMASGSATPWSFVPGLLLIGVGLGRCSPHP